MMMAGMEEASITTTTTQAREKNEGRVLCLLATAATDITTHSQTPTPLKRHSAQLGIRSFGCNGGVAYCVFVSVCV